MNGFRNYEDELESTTDRGKFLPNGLLFHDAHERGAEAVAVWDKMRAKSEQS